MTTTLQTNYPPSFAIYMEGVVKTYGSGSTAVHAIKGVNFKSHLVKSLACSVPAAREKPRSCNVWER